MTDPKHFHKMQE